MNSIKTIFFFSISFIALTGCEGMKMISPTIVAAGSGKPLAGAEINVLNGIGDSTRTDSLGQFSLRTGFTGMIAGGPKFKFEVKKEGYKTQIISSKFPADTIRLVAE
jgi:hypothetical protein